MNTFMGRRLSWVTLIGAVTASLYAIAPTKAAVLYDDLSVSSSTADPIVNGPTAGLGPLYESFSTSGSSFDFTQLTLLVGLNGKSPASGGSFEVALCDNSTTNTPGSSCQDIGTVSDSSLSATLGDLTLDSFSITLAPNTRFWIGLSSSNTNGSWSVASDTSGTGVAGEFFSNAGGTSSNVGGPYQMQISNVVTPQMQISNVVTPQMQISNVVTPATPLPAALPLFATGLGVLGLLGWRRKRKSRGVA